MFWLFLAFHKVMGYSSLNIPVYDLTQNSSILILRFRLMILVLWQCLCLSAVCTHFSLAAAFVNHQVPFKCHGFEQKTQIYNASNLSIYLTGNWGMQNWCNLKISTQLHQARDCRVRLGKNHDDSTRVYPRSSLNVSHLKRVVIHTLWKTTGTTTLPFLTRIEPQRIPNIQLQRLDNSRT